MMRREQILQKLRSVEPELRAQGVCRTAIFGSIARGDSGPDSDIDIMVEIEKDAHIGIFQYVGIVQFIEDLFPGPVDVSDRRGLKPYIRTSVERDAIYAF